MVQSETSSQDVLRDEILADAQRQAERAVRKAEREAQAAVDKAKAESQQERDSKLAAARAAAERKRTLALATVPIDIGRLRAARAEQELTKLRDTIRDKLAAREGLDYGQTLVTLAAAAIARMAGDAFVLELSAADGQAFGATLVDAVRDQAGRPEIDLTIDAQPANIQAGVIVRDPQGRQVWDNSLQARLDRMWPLLRSQLAKHLGLQVGAEPSGGQS